MTDDNEQRWTNRLHLRRILEEDVPAVAALLGHPRIRNLNAQAAEEMARSYVANWAGDGLGNWAVERNGELIGVAGLTFMTFHLRDCWDLSYCFLPEAWGKAYALEAAQEALAVAQEQSQRMPVVARTRPGDMHAFTLADKAGMVRRKDLDRDDLEVHVSHW